MLYIPIYVMLAIQIYIVHLQQIMQYVLYNRDTSTLIISRKALSKLILLMTTVQWTVSVEWLTASVLNSLIIATL